ncbi:unnamed protein product [Darwinula stevensoni]|uniref:Uncharacterized protein n=1 Tax=Darwinula stevensoni TaxID=69355 RepID=A0A7R9FQW4_9CRUS|nr:unnamed protein product [Darwinula stevensoni]CAG0900511.1 unnamed protein product [Darwinula stevensoni]
MEGRQRVFTMGKDGEGRRGIWEVLPSHTLLVKTRHKSGDFLLADSSRLIHATEKKVHVISLNNKEIQGAPYKWDEVIPITDRFIVNGTAGFIMQDSLILLGGDGNPKRVLLLDFSTKKWQTLSSMRTGRKGAALTKIDENTILVLGGEDPKGMKLLANCEYFDTRSRGWSAFGNLKMPIPLSDHAVTVCNDYIYVSGGWDGRETAKDVWRSKLNGRGSWERLPPLNKQRKNHGMVGDGAGKLSVIGGRFHRINREDIQVLETEAFKVDEGSGWVPQGKLPLRRAWKATDMNIENALQARWLIVVELRELGLKRPDIEEAGKKLNLNRVIITMTLGRYLETGSTA